MAALGIHHHRINHPRIAVAFSQGRSLDLGQTADDDPAPQPLVQLLNRLELADRLADGGFSLSLVELAQLVELPLKQLEQRRESWSWRDWRVQPDKEGRWTLQRREAGSEQS